MTAKKHGGSAKRNILALIVLGFLAILIGAFGINYTKKTSSTIIPKSPSPSSTPSDTPINAPNVGLPLRIMIPKLRVDAKIEYMGLTSTGTMDVPSEVIDAGWYKYGAHPGDEGSAVIGGHLNGVRGEPGVFLDLDKLQVGDNFSLLDDTGKTTLFVVRQIRTYGQDEQPNEVFHSQAGAHLNLITCTGTWNRSEKRFSKRLVVFADKII